MSRYIPPTHPLPRKDNNPTKPPLLPPLAPTQNRYSQVRKRRAAASSGTNATRVWDILKREDESPCSTELEWSWVTGGKRMREERWEERVEK